ncbi:unnamed protein product, partial [marine sediment metagenome]
ARLITLEAFTKDALTDQTITDELVKGTLDDDEAISRILYYSLCRAVSFYLEYIKTGERQILERVFHIIYDSVAVARDSQFVDWWWWLFCLRFLFEEYSKTSLWRQVKPFANNDDTAEKIIKKYIRCGLREAPPIIEILRSRIRYIRSRYPQPTIRRRLYKLGMALSDCETIETHREELFELFNEALSWNDWSDEKRFDLLLRISQFILELNGIRPKEVPEQWPRILSCWLKGISTIKMVESDEIKSFTNDPTTL